MLAVYIFMVNSLLFFFVIIIYMSFNNALSGSPCVLAIFFLSPLVSYGTMAVLFPLVSTQSFSSVHLYNCTGENLQCCD